VNVAGPDVPLHFSRFFPRYKLKNLPPTPFRTLHSAWMTARKNGVKYTYIGNVAGGEWEYTRCPRCDRFVVKRVGYRVIELNIEDGKCTFCGERIYGLWS